MIPGVYFPYGKDIYNNYYLFNFNICLDISTKSIYKDPHYCYLHTDDFKIRKSKNSLDMKIIIE